MAPRAGGLQELRERLIEHLSHISRQPALVQRLAAPDPLKRVTTSPVRSDPLQRVPLVGIVATDRHAIERVESDPGEFRIFRRGGGRANPLVVHVTIGGTARNGVDYERITSTVVIPAGRSWVSVPVLPIDDRTDEPRESVVVSIRAPVADAPGSPYRVARRDSATVFITNTEALHVSLSGDDDNNDGTAAQPFRTIQKAIGAAAEAGGGEIRVASGTYSTAGKDVAFSIPSTLSSLQLSGGWDGGFSSQGGTTIFVPQSAGSSLSYDVSAAADNVTISGFHFVFDGTVGPGGTRASGGILTQGRNFVLSGNTIEVGISNGAPMRSAGLQTGLGSDVTGLSVTGNTFLAEVASPTFVSRSTGIFLNPDPARSTPAVISGNTISGNNLTSAIIIDRTGLVDITSNTFTRSGPPTGFQLVVLRVRPASFAYSSLPMSDVTIQDNTFDGGSTGIGIAFSDVASATQGITDVTVADNRFLNQAAAIVIGPGAAQLSSISTEIRNNEFTGNGTGIFVSSTSGAGSSTITVDQNPITGNGTGAGIEAHGGQVTVTNSTISGNRYGVVAEGAANVSLTDVTISTSSTAGVYVFDSSTAEVFSPRVTIGTSTISGGALGIDVDAGGAIVRDSTITGFTTGIDQTGGEVLLEDSTLSGNGTGVAVSGGLTDLGDVRCQGGGNFTSLGTSHGMNTIAGNGAGVSSSALDAVLAQANWWGDPSGPSGEGPGAGDSVSTNVDFLPYRTAETGDQVAILTIDSEAAEDLNAAEFHVVRMSDDISNSLNVRYILSGTAVEGDDYGVLPGSVTILAGEHCATINLVPFDDDEVEGEETAIITLSADAAYTVGGPSFGTATIADNDAALSISDVTDTEGDSGAKDFTFTVTRTGILDRTATVSYETADGTATLSDSDYVFTSGTLTFAPGETTQTITVQVNGDTNSEPDEVFFVNLFNADGAGIAAGQGTDTIVNDDAEPPTITISDVRVPEGDTSTTPFQFTVTLSHASTEPVSVQFQTNDGTATLADADYVFSSGTLTINPGETSGTIEVLINGDTRVEPDETLFVNLFGALNGTLLDDSAQGTIENDDQPVNDPPVAADDLYETCKNRTLSVLPATGLLANDSDPELDPLTVVLVSGPGSGLLSLNGDGSFTYDPEPGFSGEVTFSYQGGDGESDSNVAVVTILVHEEACGPEPQFRADLDVDGNKSIMDAVDGVAKYLPGYQGTAAKVSTGNSYKTVRYTGQQMKLVVDGAGTNAGVTSVLFEIVEVTSYSGYAENATDSKVTGLGKEDDYSFKEREDSRSFTVTRATQDGGKVEADKAWVDFWCKDYGGKAKVKITVKRGNEVLQVIELDVPKDDDNDKIADKWELEKVTEWENQFWVNVTRPNRLTWFSPADDFEARDPDGAGNGDGGVNLPAHKTAGDGLKVIEEYRGYMLDGGGFDGNGANGHTGGHKRLSPALKELLVEVDAMAFKSGATPGIENMPTGGIAGLLMRSSKAFSDKNDGGGFRMYWAVDEGTLPHETFASRNLLFAYLKTHRNAQLKARFVHLLLAADSPDAVGAQGGTTRDTNADKDQNGSVVFIDRVKAVDDANGYPFDTSLAQTVTHELVHLLLLEPQDVPGQTAWDPAEHELDPDEDRVSGNAGDRVFLMYKATTDENQRQIKFSNVTRRELDLKNKQGLNP